MKGGRTPIHIMRFAPADFENDEAVKLAVRRRNYRALAFYMAFINHSFMAGGDLPADPERIAATLGWHLGDVRAAVGYWLAEGKLVEVNGRIVQKRVQREVAQELEFRDLQSERGKLGGRPKKADAKPPLSETESPPAPAPAPAPYASTEVRTAPADQRPPEAQIRGSNFREAVDLETKILRAVREISELTGEPAWQVCRRVTSYKRKDGTMTTGVEDPARLGSILARQKALEDAEWMLSELKKPEAVRGA